MEQAHARIPRLPDILFVAAIILVPVLDTTGALLDAYWLRVSAYFLCALVLLNAWIIPLMRASWARRVARNMRQLKMGAFIVRAIASDNAQLMVLSTDSEQMVMTGKNLVARSYKWEELGVARVVQHGLRARESITIVGRLGDTLMQIVPQRANGVHDASSARVHDLAEELNRRGV